MVTKSYSVACVLLLSWHNILDRRAFLNVRLYVHRIVVISVRPVQCSFSHRLSDFNKVTHFVLVPYLAPIVNIRRGPKKNTRIVFFELVCCLMAKEWAETRRISELVDGVEPQTVKHCYSYKASSSHKKLLFMRANNMEFAHSKTLISSRYTAINTTVVRKNIRYYAMKKRRRVLCAMC